MKIRIRTGVSLLLSLLMITAVCFCSLPVAAATIEPDPVVQSEKQTVLKGSPFQATFDFVHNYLNQKMTISVSSPNGAISLSKKTFTTDNEEIDTTPQGDEVFSYRLTIPEKYMKRVGDGSGTLRFTITYYNNDNTRDTFTVQKTIFDPIGSGSTTEQDGKLSVQSYRVDHSPIKEGEKFNLIFTLKNNGTSACNNVMAVLDSSTAEGISISGVTDTQYISSIEAGATSTITYPMTSLSKMASQSKH